MIRRLMLTTAVLALAACGAPDPEPAAPPEAPAAPVDANTLTAQGLGPLRIGMTKAEVEAAMGPDSNPGAVGGAEPDVCDQWRPERAPEGLLVMIQNGVLTRISVAEPATLKTDRGFGVGDAAAAIKAAYGADAVSRPHKYVSAPAEDIFVWASGGPTTPNAWVEDAAARGVRYEINGEGQVGMVHIGGPAIQLVEGCA
jgi:hypothetical protein